MAKQRTRK